MARKKTCSVRFLLCSTVLAASTLLWAQDWPQWRGANRDGKLQGFQAPAQWPEKLTQKWRAEVGSGDATPALVGKKLYVFTRQGNKEVVRCFNAEDGSPLWQNDYEAVAVRGASSRHPGPRSSPAVSGKYCVTLGVGGVLSCFETETGKLKWRKDPFPGVVPRFYTASSPLIVGGVVVAHLGGESKGALIAYDLETGEEKWRWQGEGPQYASPVLMTLGKEKHIVTLSARSVVAVDAKGGKLLWQRPFPPQRMAYNVATPIVQGKKVFYAGAQRGSYALAVEKAASGWKVSEQWHNPDLAPQFNSPVLLGEHIFGVSSRGVPYCLNAANGKTAWKGGASLGRGGFCGLLHGGGVLLLMPAGGELIVLKPDVRAYKELARIRVADGSTYAHPVVSGRRVFVKDRNAVTLYMLP